MELLKTMASTDFKMQLKLLKRTYTLMYLYILFFYNVNNYIIYVHSSTAWPMWILNMFIWPKIDVISNDKITKIKSAEIMTKNRSFTLPNFVLENTLELNLICSKKCPVGILPRICFTYIMWIKAGQIIARLDYVMSFIRSNKLYTKLEEFLSLADCSQLRSILRLVHWDSSFSRKNEYLYIWLMFCKKETMCDKKNSWSINKHVWIPSQQFFIFF